MSLSQQRYATVSGTNIDTYVENDECTKLLIVQYLLKGSEKT